MRDNEITQKFGEHLVALIFHNLGYEADIVDANGIDLMCYNKSYSQSYGVSVKTRNIEFNYNSGINLNWKDFVYADEETKLRGGKQTLYAFVICKLSAIYVFIFTQEYLFKHYLKMNCIEEYKTSFPDAKISGSTKTITLKNKDEWQQLYENKEEGVVFAGKYNTQMCG